MKAIREPLVQFMVLGGALFAIHQYFQERSQDRQITVTQAQVRLLSDHYRQQYGTEASAAQLEELIGQSVEQEILYREALKLGLDEGDEIIRRRLVQKYQFLQQDLAIPPPPTEDQLLGYYREHQAQYREPSTVTFTQVYFSIEGRGEGPAREAAAQMRSQLSHLGLSRAADRGDRFPGSDDFVALSEGGLGRVFGRRGLARGIFAVEPHRWSEPLRSGFGWHTVYVSERAPARQRSFDKAREDVQRDYLEAQRERRKAEAMDSLRQPYRIVQE